MRVGRASAGFLCLISVSASRRRWIDQDGKMERLKYWARGSASWCNIRGYLRGSSKVVSGDDYNFTCLPACLL